MNSTDTTRRALFGAAGLAAVALTVPAIAAAGALARAAPLSGDRAAWDAGLAAVAVAKADDDAYNIVYDRAYSAFRADAPHVDSLPLASLPGHSLGALVGTGDLDALERAHLHWIAEDKRQPAIDAFAAFRDFRRLRDDADHRHNLTAIETEWDRLGEAYNNARWALFAIPSPDLNALLWKVEQLFGESVADPDGDCPCWAGRIMEVFRADARRLLAGEG